MSPIYVTFNVMAPSDVDYLVWNARGNEATCDAQGFISAFGLIGGLMYNAMLNFFFLLIVKYEKSEEYIRTKIEPYLHGVSVAMALSFALHRLVRKHFNVDGLSGMCYWPENDPPHCNLGAEDMISYGDFEIPCGRGAEGAKATFFAGIVLILIPVFMMIVFLGMIYNTVRRQEKKLSKYGVSALRVTIRQAEITTQQQNSARANMNLWGRMRTSVQSIVSRSSAGSSASFNNSRSNSRPVMYKAVAYSSAWLLSYGFWILGMIWKLVDGSWPDVLIYLTNIFIPLQGLFNLIIYILPKVVAAKTSKRDKISWCQAIYRALRSRGNGGKNRRSNLRSNRRPRKTRNRKKLKKQRPRVPQEEEEKFEIETAKNETCKSMLQPTYALNVASH
eukprot:CAMPEP_0204646878 /NCGR_PEP_ID=MMETSP0718-20130828/5220_1 /ASSEMBLY_ACC=CAM_ASM_000674 /TAXON_ID=230516 /ORGANISM="Chaetoceros curvisetus" /LENGTH=389 /DNA_ID=CAMNT_0051669267 /DNA_START=225 /DNA_END=1394 /DNA_ORIENTATION=+